MTPYRTKQVPPFPDENAGPEKCPTPEQIRERATVLRSYWDRARWLKERRRHLSGSVFRSSAMTEDAVSDAQLIRRLLWTDRDELSEVLKAHHARRRAKG